jgi:hypothetical protein
MADDTLGLMFVVTHSLIILGQNLWFSGDGNSLKSMSRFGLRLRYKHIISLIGVECGRDC